MTVATQTHPGFASHADGSEPSQQPQAAVATLTPAEIDLLISNYQEQQKIADESQAIADMLASQLTALVRQHGTKPDNAGQSWRMEGVHNSATVTISTTKSLRDENITSLLRYLHDHGLSALFHKMFAISNRYTLLDGSRDVLNGVDLPQRTRDKIHALFGMCLEVKDKKPSLKVSAVKPEKPARKPRKGKVAA